MKILLAQKFDRDPSGGPYLANVIKREGSALHTWGNVVRRELAGRFDLKGGYQPGGLRRLRPAQDTEKQ